nr:hypothetical protein [Tanacetum cinerariifolium]
MSFLRLSAEIGCSTGLTDGLGVFTCSEVGTQLVFNSFVFDCNEMFSFDSDVSMPASPVYDRYKSEEGYHDVPLPYTRTFMPPKPDLVFHDALTVNETIPTAFNVEPSSTKPTQDLS